MLEEGHSQTAVSHTDRTHCLLGSLSQSCGPIASGDRARSSSLFVSAEAGQSSIAGNTRPMLISLRKRNMPLLSGGRGGKTKSQGHINTIIPSPSRRARKKFNQIKESFWLGQMDAKTPLVAVYCVILGRSRQAASLVSKFSHPFRPVFGPDAATFRPRPARVVVAMPFERPQLF